MVDGLGADVQASASPCFSVDTEFGGRAEIIANRIRDHFGLADQPRCRVEVLKSPPAHSGLGSGTQISLAITECIVRSIGCKADRDTLIQLSERGQRSAVGVHGYFDGGFIAEGCVSDVERTKKQHRINTVFRRIEFPRDWRVAVLLPSVTAVTVEGETEQNHFAKLRPADEQTRSVLTSMLQDQIIPAADKALFEVFAEHIEDYNRRSGELFAAVQGGPYNGTVATNMVELAKAMGGHGVGQSSWGMGVFAWFASPEEANRFALGINSNDNHCTCEILKPRNRGRSLGSSAQVTN